MSQHHKSSKPQEKPSSTTSTIPESTTKGKIISNFRCKELGKDQLSLSWIITYRSKNKESCEQVPQGDEKEGYNASNVVVGSECYYHHTIEYKVDKAHANEVEKPKEFVSSPGKANHWKEEQGIQKTLCWYVYDLDAHLWTKEKNAFCGCHRKEP